jgi:hypothetical protein
VLLLAAHKSLHGYFVLYTLIDPTLQGLSCPRSTKALVWALPAASSDYFEPAASSCLMRLLSKRSA